MDALIPTQQIEFYQKIGIAVFRKIVRSENMLVPGILMFNSSEKMNPE